MVLGLSVILVRTNKISLTIIFRSYLYNCVYKMTLIKTIDMRAASKGHYTSCHYDILH